MSVIRIDAGAVQGLADSLRGPVGRIAHSQSQVLAGLALDPSILARADIRQRIVTGHLQLARARSSIKRLAAMTTSAARDYEAVDQSIARHCVTLDGPSQPQSSWAALLAGLAGGAGAVVAMLGKDIAANWGDWVMRLERGMGGLVPRILERILKHGGTSVVGFESIRNAVGWLKVVGIGGSAAIAFSTEWLASRGASVARRISNSAIEAAVAAGATWAGGAAGLKVGAGVGVFIGGPVGLVVGAVVGAGTGALVGWGVGKVAKALVSVDLGLDARSIKDRVGDFAESPAASVVSAAQMAGRITSEGWNAVAALVPRCPARGLFTGVGLSSELDS